MKLNVAAILCLQAAVGIAVPVQDAPDPISRAVVAADKQGRGKHDKLDEFGCKFDGIVDGKILALLPFVGAYFKKKGNSAKCQKVLGKLKEAQDDYNDEHKRGL